ncbi:MAG: DUF4019 domain-containing protein [Deltaproteobacteria bacterium]|nr:DUF4019 domain-containing protein [Deltaproteobacteria bacterium]
MKTSIRISLVALGACSLIASAALAQEQSAAKVKSQKSLKAAPAPTAADPTAKVKDPAAAKVQPTREQQAQQAAEAWLKLIDAGQYDQSHAAAAKLFRGAVAKEMWAQQVKGVREPLGTLKLRRLKSATFATSLPGAPDGEYVVIQFETSFTNKKNAIETVTPMRDPDGAWRVSGYYIK